ncbi:ribosome biogenesis GTP-binding protein YihA/YsxC [Rapidithrix thailandica]|uniref:Probable GTP-binding protein EngB n=1 Tax=Rapidithrix thailandica TaxID=413964 RepID=A0AAW9RT57_9BACT
MAKYQVTSAEFVISNQDYKKCPKPTLPEFAFIGRSNVGKSSLINALTQRTKLAKISGKPGKTQLINHFIINDQWYLVDLPGYGWAQVSKTQREKFQQRILDYIENRESLVCTFVLVDIRHEPQKIDLEFMEWMGVNGLPFMVVFTKADKLTPNKIQQSLSSYRKTVLKTWEEMPPYVVTSSLKKDGLEDLWDKVQEFSATFKG